MIARTAAGTAAVHEGGARARSWLRRNGVLAGSALVSLLLIVNYNALAPADGDAIVQFRFVQKLFGDYPSAIGYSFGLGLIEAPFYALGKLLQRIGVDTIHGVPPPEVCIGIGLGLLPLASWPLLAPVIRGLRLRGAPFALPAGVLGTPLFFYASFDVGKNHPIDAVLFAAVVYLVFRYLRADVPERWLTFALGAVFGLSYSVRYFDGAEAVGLLLVLLAWRRWRHALEIAVTSAATFGLLYLVPLAYGVSVFGGRQAPDQVLTFAPLNPLRMLFTDHRGYFVWSPVAALGAIGFVLLFRRRPEHRRFLTAVAAMSLGIIVSYSLIPFWDGTWAFGQRYYTPLFAPVVIGLAGLIDIAPRVTVAAATAAAAWSLFLCFNFALIGGPQYLATTPGGVEDLAVVPATTHQSLGSYLWGMRHKSNLLP